VHSFGEVDVLEEIMPPQSDVAAADAGDAAAATTSDGEMETKAFFVSQCAHIDAVCVNGGAILAYAAVRRRDCFNCRSVPETGVAAA